MLDLKTDCRATDIRTATMAETIEPSPDNISVIAQDCALSVLFAVLRRHNATLADDLALEFGQVAAELPHYMPANVTPLIQARLRQWAQALQDQPPNGSTPAAHN